MTDAILTQVSELIPNIPLTMVSQGAEALVLRSPVHPYLSNGMPCMVKYRPPKPYRHPKIDQAITKQRTVGEAKFMAKLAKLGLPAPKLVLVDAPNGVIWMLVLGSDLQNGTVSSLKNYLWEGEKSQIDCYLLEIERILVSTGRVIGQLHSNDMVHGDLTSSNIILHNLEAHLIDFGLLSYSNLPEDKAVDLYVMERAILSTHSDFAEKYNQWLLQGYKEGVLGGKNGQSSWKSTIKKLEDVRLRGRKRSMLG